MTRLLEKLTTPITDETEFPKPGRVGDWIPIPHRTLIKKLRKAITAEGCTITAEEMAAGPGKDDFAGMPLCRVYGCFVLQGVEGVPAPVICFRNTYDATFATSITVGFVLSGGEVVIYLEESIDRRDIDREDDMVAALRRQFPRLLTAAVKVVVESIRNHIGDGRLIEGRLANYRAHKLRGADYAHLLLEVAAAKVVGVQSLLPLWRADHVGAQGVTVEDFLTDMAGHLAGTHPCNLPKKTIRLIKVLDGYCGPRTV